MPSGFRVPDLLLPGVLQPLALSTFTASNGTSLGAITPEVGGAWTEHAGDFEIQTNRAENGHAADNGNATIDAGISDALMRVTLNCKTAPFAATLARYSDENNQWRVFLDNNLNNFQLYEINGGGVTQRASAAVAIADNTEYDVVTICDGQTIDCFLDGGNKITYGSASHNETETEFGVRLDNSNAGYADNFHIHPLTDVRFDALDGV